MATFVTCERCSTLLQTEMDVTDPFFLRGVFTASHHELRNDGYALNVVGEDGTCPTCGFDTGTKGTNVPPIARKEGLQSPNRLGPKHWQFLCRHSLVHVRSDYGRANATDHYFYAHRALMHFTRGGALSVFGSSIACTALLDPETVRPSIQYLAHLVDRKGDVDFDLIEQDPASVADAVGTTLLSEAIRVHSFGITDASCIVVEMPPPGNDAEAQFVGIVLATDLEQPLVPEELDRSTPFLYLTLERAAEHNGIERTMVGQWRADGSRRNYGTGSRPDVHAFIDVVERIWVSRVWE